MGRAGRVQKGICYRLFSETDFLGRSPFTQAEIECSDFSEAVLLLKSTWGLISTLPPLTGLPPLEKNLRITLDGLMRIGAVDQKETLTSWGKRLAKLPVHPRIGAMLLTGDELSLGSEAALLAALISEDYILDHKFIAPTDTSCDLCYQANIFLKWKRSEEQEHSSIDRALSIKKLKNKWIGNGELWKALSRRVIKSKR